MQQTQINPFQHVLDDEAYSLLTKCDPKLGVAVLSLAVKKFSESKEFLYFLKPENRLEFEDKVVEEVIEQAEGNDANISMNSDTSNTSNTSNMNNSNTTDIANNSTASSPAAISVAW